MNGALLSILIFLPILASAIVAFSPISQKVTKYITLIVAAVQLCIAIGLYLNFSQSAGEYGLASFSYVEKVKWFEFSLANYGKISADYFVGIDGLGLSMVLLSVLVMVIATISSWNITDRYKGYFALFLLLNGAIIGCFVALDFLLFYLFFEFMLLPMYFLIGLWGGPRREYASIKFFLYTLFGSILILIVLIALNISTIDPVKTAIEVDLIETADQYSDKVETQVHKMLNFGKISSTKQVHTFNLIYMTDPANLIPGSILDTEGTRMLFGLPLRLVAFLLIFIGFAIKIPVVPFHTWLPDAHVEAPTPISVILAGVLLKVGAYGLIRAGIFIFPDGLIHFSWWLGALGVISIIYGAMNALASNDLKKLIAYSSVSHMGFVLLGITALSSEGFGGAIYQMVSHGVISAGLFLIAGVLSDRTHDRLIENYSGLAQKMPKYTVMVVIFFFASMGLPGLSGFIAEIFVLIGSFISPILPGWMMIVASVGLVLSAAYYLWTIQRMFYGPFYYRLGDSNSVFTDLTKRENLMLWPLVLLALVLGIFPHFLFDIINESVNQGVDLLSSQGILNLKSILK
ncbi:complex I subunit 4 family protein [Fulvivirga lutea]|uniref:NADH-quinone oxidoreductase subunit M n=1 Tax=Fulvivirga lutea TaxID=2810512 RepID=A0A974WF59_9BACT|nr:NADH-quinone oxidoreductase subunit M [Fulvivirga lutea]QSE95947.1 NADH-quinone oxidoreductase subunit M [Fulvivirga lutea]